ncbi:acyl-CoA dehydrogenase family protein [Streptomyces sp. NBC_01180]|uniref:acyl-CoA dehydrogenase family protein n=1 Tax=Streptomyces sp. NBC_01180 TaxID=2903763 RepID=UPI00386CE6C7|nr:acyl-CoA/acyl-ACP dehydrogenase [Streptomyces sp. NBC_01180]
MATSAELAEDPMVSAVTDVAAGVLLPVAEETAQGGVPRSHLDELARIGAFGLVGYEPGAGSGVSARNVVWEAHEILSAADPSTWFVFTQHFALVKGLLKSGNAELRERWLPMLRRGERLATAGFAFLNHPQPPVTAEPLGDGWRLRGRVPWMTGWGIAGLAFIGAVTPDDQALFVLIDCAAQGSRLTAVDSPPLWAMNATHTTAVELRDVVVPADEVISLEPRKAWSLAYDLENANSHPAVFGHLRSAADYLIRSAPRAGATYERLGHRLAEEAARLRAEAYALRDELPPEEGVEERIAIRSAVLDLGVRAATACVAATGGRAVQYGNTAGRLAREAQFHLIQAQTGQLRAETARAMLRGM